jgi:hypothetical protein
MSNVNTESTKVTARQVAVTAFNAALPFKAEIGDRAFRGMVLAQLRTMYKHNSVPVMYNFAMDNAIEQKLCKPFGKKHGMPIGPKVELADAQVEAVNSAMASAIAIATGQEDVLLTANMTWKVYNKKSGDTVHYATNRKQAYELRNGDKALSCKAIK